LFFVVACLYRNSNKKTYPYPKTAFDRLIDLLYEK